MTVEFSLPIFEESSNIKFHGIRPVGAELSHTDRQIDMTELIVAIFMYDPCFLYRLLFRTTNAQLPRPLRACPGDKPTWCPLCRRLLDSRASLNAVKQREISDPSDLRSFNHTNYTNWAIPATLDWENLYIRRLLWIRWWPRGSLWRLNKAVFDGLLC